jgi:SulP family sulfate permease
MSAVFTISFAAIIYTGELSQFLSRGIGLVLLGNAIMALFAAWFLAFRGSVAFSQDAPAVLIAGASSAIVAQGQLSGDALFATVVGLLFTAAFLTGLASVLCARFKLAFVARFIPYPVLGGFLAATGLLLFLGGLGVTMGEPVSIWQLPMLFESNRLLSWGPWIGVALIILISMYQLNWSLTLPVFALIATIGFYGVLSLFGLSLEDANARGWLLGPFPEGGFTKSLDPSIVTQIDWLSIMGQVPVILAVIALSLIAMALNISGLELELGTDIDINQDMSNMGKANMIASFGGGLVGYHLVSMTLLARQLGAVGPMAGISVAIGCGITLLFGASVLSVLPVGIFGAIIALMGMDLLFTWIWVERRKLSLFDYALVILIPVIAVTYGFLFAVGVGLFVAAVQFIITYAKLDVVRLQTTLANRRSFVERPENEIRTLNEYGQGVLIMKLSGFLFFGSANALRERMIVATKDSVVPVRSIILDLETVEGMDISAGQALQKINDDCADGNIQLVLCGLQMITKQPFVWQNQSNQPLEFETIELALEQQEKDLLSEYQNKNSPENVGFFDQLSQMYPHVDFDDHVDHISLKAGDTLVEKGEQSFDIYLLKEGRLNVLVPIKNGGMRLIAQVREGALVGELAHYTQTERSARMEAIDDVKLIRFDSRKLDTLSEDNPKFIRDFHKLAAGHLARRLARTTRLLNDIGI